MPPSCEVSPESFFGSKAGKRAASDLSADAESPKVIVSLNRCQFECTVVQHSMVVSKDELLFTVARWCFANPEQRAHACIYTGSICLVVRI